MTSKDDELFLLPGEAEGTRKKLERSSGAVVQYVAHVALSSGSKEVRIKEVRIKAKEDMKWLFDQLEGPVYVGDWEERVERTVVDIPANCIGCIG